MFSLIFIINLTVISSTLEASSEAEMMNGAYQSTYNPDPSPKFLIKNGTLLTGTGVLLEKSSVLIENNRIVSVGSDIDETGATVIDADGKWITPGIIDIHSHMGLSLIHI